MKNKKIKKSALILALIVLADAFVPSALLALTSGPSQPEFASFEPVGTTEMVDLFSGDFVYNIPLFELPGPSGGYPFNLAYHSGVTMEQEASWVGLGWTLNAGALQRNVRGIPDDFLGDTIITNTNMKPDRTWKFSLKPNGQIIGIPIPINGVDLKLALAIEFSHNTYKGWGVGLNIGANPSLFKMGKKYFRGGLGLNVNGIEGASLQPSIGLQGKTNTIVEASTINATLGSRQGLESIGLQYNETYEFVREGREKNDVSSSTSSANLSFAKRAFTPRSSLEFSGKNFSGAFGTGGKILFIDAGGSIGVSYSNQKLKHNGKDQFHRSRGYMHLRGRDYSKSKKSFFRNEIMDYDREKSTAITSTSPNLSIPSTKPDIFSAAGQGMAGTFRAYRSDIGIMHEQRLKSETASGSLGFEFNAGSGVHGGVDLGGNYSISKNTIWKNSESDFFKYYFKTQNYFIDEGKSINESFYFKNPGELSAQKRNAYDYMVNDLTVAYRMNLLSGDLLADIEPKFTTNGVNSIDPPRGHRLERETRSNNIEYVTNEQLLNAEHHEYLHQYRVQIKGANGFELLDRKANKRHHIAGMTVVQPSGMRYIYGLPQKNISTIERTVTFSKGSTEPCNLVDFPTNLEDSEYDQTRTTPEYTNNFLLTAVVGPDYMDNDGIPGVSDGDGGYWVKFSYEKTSNYNWRSPIWGGSYQPGIEAVDSDDKVSMVYGEREQYYLNRAETKTHFANFNLSSRTDGLSPTETQQIGAPFGSPIQKKLDEIELMAKIPSNNNEEYGGYLLKTIVLGHENLLGASVPNSEDNKKLTLKELYINNGHNTRGSQSPYIFNYKNSIEGSEIGYQFGQVDRWGTLKLFRDENNEIITEAEELKDLLCQVVENPYTKQHSSEYDIQEEKNEISSLWHLEKITLPSGASVMVDYEADDYAYVQDRVAMQMFNVTDVSLPTINIEQGDACRVHFETEEAVNNAEDVVPYIHDLHGIKLLDNNGVTELHPDSDAQLYFKYRTNIKGSGGSLTTVRGYAKVTGFGKDGNGAYLDLRRVKRGANYYHPFVASAWQFLKTQMPSALYSDDYNYEYEDTGFLEAIGRFGQSWKEIREIFRGYWKYCSDKNFAGEVHGNSLIRLCSPDMIKYGGGVRVKKITLEDNWSDGQLYGQYYDYTTTNEDGDIISSGVATNEPAVGHDECALRYAKLFTEKSVMKAPESSFFEYPINESYYPGASVGYSKVSVRSLATASLDESTNLDMLPTGFSPTGLTVHEFYTAKDFPIITEETNLHPLQSDMTNNLSGFLQSLFGHRRSSYIGSQGYSVRLNNMHGKVQKVTHYGMDKNGLIVNQPINQVIYKYKEGKKILNYPGPDKRFARTLNNEVPVLVDLPLRENDATEAVIDSMLVGVTQEFVTDINKNFTFSGHAGVNTNADFTAIGVIPIPTAIALPSLTSTTNVTKTATTNKIIRQNGIIDSIISYDGQSQLITKNEVFDKYTGEAILTSVNNAFDNEIFNWDMKAHNHYSGMSAASQNWGIKGIVQYVGSDNCLGHEFAFDNIMQNSLTQGDEFILMIEGEKELKLSGKAIGKITCLDHLQNLFYADDIELINTAISNMEEKERLVAVNIRSGHRNQLAQSVGQISALKSPLIGWIDQTTTMNGESPDGTFTLTKNIKSINNVLNASSQSYSDGWNAGRDVTDDDQTIRDIDLYQIGELGIYRPWATFNYVDSRDYSENFSIENDGTVKNLSIPDVSDPHFNSFSETNKWKRVNSIIEYNDQGYAVQNQSVIGVVNHATHEENGLVRCVVSNSRKIDASNRNFEQYYLSPEHTEAIGNIITFPFIDGTLNSDLNKMWLNLEYGGPNLQVNEQRHRIIVHGVNSEGYALTLDEYAPAFLFEASSTGDNLPEFLTGPFHEVEYVPFCGTFENGNDFGGRILFTDGGHKRLYEGQEEEGGHTGISAHLLQVGSSLDWGIENIHAKKLHISFWLKISDSDSDLSDYESLLNEGIEFSNNISLKPVTDIIEGWQKYEGTINSGNPDIENNSDHDIFIDDARIHPIDAKMVSYVYDPNSLRLIAELDENNFATFYEYDPAGNLIAIKKETEKGIKTIQESFTHVKE